MKSIRRGPLFVALLSVVLACENPQPPAACGAIPQVTVHAGETSNVTACFIDPNGDMLSYSATSSNPGVATVSISATTITVTAVAPGGASVTITATDVGGLQGQSSFQVMVPNRAPLPRGAIPSMTVPVDESQAVDASQYFTEPDGETLFYGATSSNSSVATVSVTGATVTAIGKGTNTVTVTATDPGALAASQTFQTMVPNRPPESVGMISDETVEVGEAATINLMPYLEDPDGDNLTYTAAASNSGVAHTSVVGSTLSITATAKGTTTVMVTARDADGLSAAQTLQAMVPNRPPEPMSSIAGETIGIGETVTISSATYFTDPDGDALTYTATSSSTSVAAVSVSGSAVRIRGVATGSATITITARDPGGLTATQQARVTVTGGRVRFRDEFSSAASLDDWKLEDAAAVVRNGVLRLTKTNSSLPGMVVRAVAPDLTSWTIKTRMGRAQTTNSLVGVWWTTGHARYTMGAVNIGPVELQGFTANFTAWYYDADEQKWVAFFAARASAINEGAGELTEIGVSSASRRLRIVAGNREFYNESLTALGRVIFRRVGAVVLASEGVSERTTLFDRIEVEGEAVSNTFFADGSTDLYWTDALELAKEIRDGRILSAKSLKLFEGPPLRF